MILIGCMCECEYSFLLALLALWWPGDLFRCDSSPNPEQDEAVLKMGE